MQAPPVTRVYTTDKINRAMSSTPVLGNYDTDHHRNTSNMYSIVLFLGLTVVWGIGATCCDSLVLQLCPC